MKGILLQPVKAENIPALLCIINNELGINYLSKETIENYLKHKLTYCVQAIFKQETVGFSVIRILSNQEFINQYALNHKMVFEELLKNSQTILYRMHTVVSKKFQKKGIANALVKFTQEKYEPIADTSISVAWVKNNKCSIENILLELGFNVHAELKNYWEKDSIQKKYYCASCKAIPCVCTAKIFVKNTNK